MVNITVFGNGAIDVRVDGELDKTNNKLTIEYGGVREAVELVDTNGEDVKLRAKKTLEGRINGVELPKRVGGGGPTSAISIATLAIGQRQISVFDLSFENQLFVDEYRKNRIQYMWGRKRKLPINYDVHLRDRKENILVRGKSLERIPLTHGYFYDYLGASISNCQSLLINGAKDGEWVNFMIDVALENRTNLFFVPTDSLDYDMVPNRMLPNGIVVANVKELYKMANGNYPRTDSAMLGFGKETALDWSRMFAQSPYPFYITLGKHGMFVCDKKYGVCRVHLEGKQAEELNALTIERTGRTTGMGDVGTGGIAMLSSSVSPEIIQPTTIAKLSQIAAVKSILGYKGELSERSYNVEPVSL